MHELPRQDTHTDEHKSRVAADATDRIAIREKLDRSIDPLSTSNEAGKLVNIVSLTSGYGFKVNGRVTPRLHTNISIDQ
jgi:hypothetical protein